MTIIEINSAEKGSTINRDLYHLHPHNLLSAILRFSFR